METKTKALVTAGDIAPGYEIKRFKSFRGMEGLGFDLDLHRAGRRVASVQDGGNGGSLRFDFVDDKEEGLFAEAMRAHKASLPPAQRKESFGEDRPGEKWQEALDLGIFMAIVVEAFENERRFRRKCKGATLVQVGDMVGGGEFYVYRMPFSPEAKASILAKFPGQTVVFLNEELAR